MLNFFYNKTFGVHPNIIFYYRDLNMTIQKLLFLPAISLLFASMTFAGGVPNSSAYDNVSSTNVSSANVSSNMVSKADDTRNFFDASKFYVEGYIGTGLDDAEESNNFAGASGYVAAGPTGKIGDVSEDEDTTFGLKLGYVFSENLSFELELMSLGYGDTTWRTDFASNNGTFNPATSDPFRGELTSKAIFLNTYYNWNLDNFKPYIGFGLGVSRNKFHQASESGSAATIHDNIETDFAYKLDVGSLYEITSDLSINLGVSFLDIGDYESDDKRTINSNLEAIAPYKFGTDGLEPVVTLGIRKNF
jgi:opacity protein-like surface antigen